MSTLFSDKLHDPTFVLKNISTTEVRVYIKKRREIHVDKDDVIVYSNNVE